MYAYNELSVRFSYRFLILDPYPAKLLYLNFQPLEVVYRGG